MIHIRELYFRTTTRPEILPGALRPALMDAGIAVCRQSNLLKETVYATLPAGATKILVPTAADQDVNRVDEVFYRDPADPNNEWRQVGEVAPALLERQRVHAESMNPGAPQYWGLRGSTLYLQAPADAQYPLRIKFSWSPTRSSQPEAFDLPAEAEDAICFYARWLLLQDIDPKAADAALKKFDSELADLRAMGETGESGTRHILDFLPSEG